MAQTGYIRRNEVLRGASVAVPSSQSRYPVSNEIPLTAQDSINFAARVVVTNVVLSGSSPRIVLYLQDDFGDGFTDVGAPQAVVPITADGIYEISLCIGVEGEAMLLPLGQVARLAIFTNSASSCTVTAVYSSHRI